MSSSLRLSLLALFAFGVLGVGCELALLGHYEDTKQWIPLILLALGAVAVAWLATVPSRASVRLFRGLMILFAVGGVVGLVLHFRTNAALERELYPAMAGWSLFWEAVRGATPALAPATLIQLGLLGLLTTYRHPALEEAAASEKGAEG